MSAVVRYRFERLDAGGAVADVQERDLPDGAAAVAWMGNEFLGVGERLLAFRGGDPAQFAARQFGGNVEVFG